MIRFPCGTCGRRLRVPARLAGKRGRCERCGAVNRVPLADALPPDADHAPDEPEPGLADEPSEAAAVAPPPSPETDLRDTPTAPPPTPEPAQSFSTEAVPADQSAAVEPPRPAFGIDEASVFPPIGEFGSVPEIDFSHPPSEPTEDAGHEAVEAEEEPRREDASAPVGEAAPDAEITKRPEPENEPPQESGGIVPVDVRRASLVSSPFRSTADMRPREVIEGSVEVAAAQFAATTTLPGSTGPAGAGSAGAASTFLDLVAQRVGVIHEPAPASVRGAAPASASASASAPVVTKIEPMPPKFHPATDAEESEDGPVVRILHINVDDAPRAAPARPVARDPWTRAPQSYRPSAGRAALPPVRAEPGTMSARRAVVMALVVGLIVGFVLGLMVADLL